MPKKRFMLLDENWLRNHFRDWLIDFNKWQLIGHKVNCNIVIQDHHGDDIHHCDHDSPHGQDCWSEWAEARPWWDFHLSSTSQDLRNRLKKRCSHFAFVFILYEVQFENANLCKLLKKKFKMFKEISNFCKVVLRLFCFWKFIDAWPSSSLSEQKEGLLYYFSM